MGTQKRERQKANRQQRLIEEARAERVGTVKRTVLRWGIGGVAALGAIVLIAWIGGAFDSDEDTASDLPSDIPTVVTDPPTDVTNPPAETYIGGTTPADDTTGKPSAQLPTEAPTELVITDIDRRHRRWRPERRHGARELRRRAHRRTGPSSTPAMAPRRSRWCSARVE